MDKCKYTCVGFNTSFQFIVMYRKRDREENGTNEEIAQEKASYATRGVVWTHPPWE